MSIPLAVEELIAMSKAAECSAGWGYTIVKEKGVWLASFVTDWAGEQEFGLDKFHSVERDTANAAFEWCNSHRKAIESLLPQEVV